MMHYHGSLGRVIGFLTLLLLSVTGILVGLMAFNVNLMEHSFIHNNLHFLVKPLQVAVGISGVLGILYLLGIGVHHTHNTHK